MATQYLKALTQEGTHAVGSINVIQVETLAHGAKVITAPVDNWTLVELAGYDEEGALCKQVTAQNKVAYLVGTPEQRFLGEDIAHFFNDIGEFVRPIVLKPHYTRFETSGFTLNTGVTEVVKGQVAHFDVTTKKYIISAAGTPHADFATAGYKFEVVGDLDDTAGNFDQPTVRLMVTKVL